MTRRPMMTFLSFFFFNDTATTEIYTLSLHDALPIFSLGEYTTVGNLMGALVGGSLVIEGYIARLMYMSLYKMHELALHGCTKVALDTVARLITRRTEPHVKLH